MQKIILTFLCLTSTASLNAREYTPRDEISGILRQGKYGGYYLEVRDHQRSAPGLLFKEQKQVRSSLGKLIKVNPAPNQNLRSIRINPNKIVKIKGNIDNCNGDRCIKPLNERTYYYQNTSNQEILKQKEQEADNPLKNLNL
jgi:hypothetical protein